MGHPTFVASGPPAREIVRRQHQRATWFTVSRPTSGHALPAEERSSELYEWIRVGFLIGEAESVSGLHVEGVPQIGAARTVAEGGHATAHRRRLRVVVDHDG